MNAKLMTLKNKLFNSIEGMLIIGGILGNLVVYFIPPTTNVIKNIIGGSILGALCFIMFLFIVNCFSSSPWFCEVFGWHNNKDITYADHDGCSQHGNCKRCGTKVMQDSNGDWFGCMSWNELLYSVYLSTFFIGK